MKSIDEIQDEIIEEFSVFDDWMDKYALLIDLGKDRKSTRLNSSHSSQSRMPSSA